MSPRFREWTLVITAMSVAVATRVLFLGSKPFWRDEAWVASLVGRPLRDAIDLHLPVPIGFVALTKLADWLPGLPPEVSYRLLPMICGIIALPLLYHLAYSLSGSRTIAVIGLWLASGLPALVYYSRELKSYEIDFLFAVLVPLLALRLFECDAAAKTGSGRTVTVIALLASLTAAPWLSFGSFFPVAATLAWGWLGWRRASRATRWWWLLATLVYSAAFGAAYWVVVQSQVGFAADLPVWERSLFSAQGFPSWVEVVRAVSNYFGESLTYLFQRGWPVAAPLMLIGAWSWPKQGRGFLCWLCFGSAAVAVAAALANHYLLAQGRFLLFAAPPYLLFAAAGLVQVGRWFEPWLGRSAGHRIAVGIAFSSALYSSGATLLHRTRSSPETRYFVHDVLEDVEPLITRAAATVPPGDPLLVSSSAGRAFRFYARGRLSHATVLRQDGRGQAPVAFRGWLATVDQDGWIILVRKPDERWLGKLLEEQGFDYRQVASERGTLLLKISRRRG